jgi:hypothetical protein
MDKATVALVLSASAIAVSGTIGILGHRLQRRVTSIEVDRRSEEVDAQRRADLYARLDPPGRPDHLVISCAGGTSARDVVVEVEPATILLEGEPMSFPSLKLGQEVRIRAVITHDDFPAGVPRVVLVHLNWWDDRGPQANEVSLTV